jgi:hypothetical protein
MNRALLLYTCSLTLNSIASEEVMPIESLLLAGNSFAQTNTTNNRYFVSIFGSKVAEQEYDNLSVQFQYGIPNTILTTTLLNGGTATTANSEAILSTSGTAGSVAGVESFTSLRYVTGHEANALFTAAFTGSLASNTQQYIGILDNLNGFAIGFKGTSFGIITRNNSIDTFITQSSFNGDKLDGTGPSGFLYNRNNLNVFRISYGWLGSSVAKFHIMNSNGNWILFHTMQYPNSSPYPSIANAMLPMGAQVFDPAGGNSLTLKTSGWNMSIVNIDDKIGNRAFIVTNQKIIPLATETHLLTLRNQTSFQSISNQINLTFVRYIIGLTDTTNVPMIARVYKNATVTGTSFSSVNAATSVTSYSTAGTFVAGTGTLYLVAPFSGYSAEKASVVHSPFYTLLAYPGDTLTLTVQLPGASATVIGGIEWTEGF